MARRVGGELRQGQGLRQLPLPAGPIPFAVAQRKGADLHGNQVGPQGVKQGPGPGIPLRIAVHRADEGEALIGDIFPNGVFPQLMVGSNHQPIFR